MFVKVFLVKVLDCRSDLFSSNSFATSKNVVRFMQSGYQKPKQLWK